MSTYAIGDIQGCLDPLLELLHKIDFDPEQDTLWFTGDLINRGPDSLGTLRYIKTLGDRAVSVLGNHDLHFLAIAEGHSQIKSQDTFDELLAAPDLQELVHWLRSRPLMHYDKSRNMALIHAGLPPQWNTAQALACAHEVESILKADNYRELLVNMYANSPTQWDDNLQGIDRHRYIINCFTRMRFCHKNGQMDFEYKTAPGTQPESLQPWFTLDQRMNKETTILFGHWSTLGLYHEHNVYSLDSGCLWRREMTALDIDSKEIIQVSCH